MNNPDPCGRKAEVARRRQLADHEHLRKAKKCADAARQLAESKKGTEDYARLSKIAEFKEKIAQYAEDAANGPKPNPVVEVLQLLGILVLGVVVGGVFLWALVTGPPGHIQVGPKIIDIEPIEKRPATQALP